MRSVEAALAVRSRFIATPKNPRNRTAWWTVHVHYGMQALHGGHMDKN